MKKYVILFLVILSFGTVFSQNICKEEKILGLSKIWKEVEYNFVYFHASAINWDSLYVDYLGQVINSKSDEEYYILLSKFLATFHDGHTFITTPNSLISKKTKKIWPYFTNGKIFIIGIGEELQEKLPIGSEIISVNNKPVLEYLDSLYSFYNYPKQVKYYHLVKKLFFASVGTKFNIEIININTNKIENVEFEINNKPDNWAEVHPPYHVKNNFSFRFLTTDIAYINFGRIFDASSLEHFIEIVDSLKESKGIIIDLRKNLGGSSVGSEICKYFTSEDKFISQIVKTRENNSAGRAIGYLSMFSENRDIKSSEYEDYINNNKFKTDTLVVQNDCEISFKQPIIILTSENTASAAEALILTFKNINRGIIVGNNTYGSISQPLILPLSNNGLAKISTQRVFYANGEEFFFFKPDIKVNIEINDILQNNDVVLDKAIKILQNK